MTVKRKVAGLVAAISAIGIIEKTSNDSSWWSSLSGVRIGRAAIAVFLVAVDYKWTLSGQLSDEKLDQLRSQVHLRSSQRLVNMCRKNGGCYIKIGQHIGSMEYLLPKEYVQTFKIFHTDAPRTSLIKLKKVIEEELKRPVDTVFDVIDEEPLGAASLAQCHRCVLVDGTEVAVKIQHPHVKKNGFTDMMTVNFLAGCIVKLFPSFQFQWLAEEVSKNLPVELDFSNEGRNIRKCAALFKDYHFIKVPQVHMATPRLLIMEYCKGGKINDMKYIKDNKISVNEISLKVAQMYSLMIYQYGFIHCDPHPGNILIRKPHQDKKEDVEIVLLDHGLYQQLTNDFRLLYCKLWHGLITRDNDSIKKYCQELEAGELYPLLACIITARSWDSIQQGIGSVSRTNIENNLIRNDAYLYFSEITQLLNKVPRQLILILKTNDLLRGLEQSLGSSCHTHSHITMSRHCLRAIYEAEENNKNSLYHRLMLKLKMRMSLFALYMYEWWLKFTT